MIAMSTKEPVRWTPPWREGEDGAPVFLLRAGSVIDRMNFEAELAGEHRAGRVYDFELAAAFEAGVDAILGEGSEDAEGIKALLASEAELGPGETLPRAEAAALASAREAVSEAWPDYRSLIAQSERRRTVTPVLAFRRFCVGWEGEGLPVFKRGLDGQVAVDGLGAIDALVMQVAGSRAYSLLYDGGQEKNLPPPSTSGGTPSATTSSTAPADGSSAAKRGRKTPA